MTSTSSVIATSMPSSPSNPTLLPNVQLSYGPMLIGVFMNMILYGVFVVQAYSYYQVYKKDVRWIKYLVFYLFIVETVNTGIDMAMMYQPLILEYGQPPRVFPVMFAAEPITTVAVSTPIQLFFAWRIRLLTKQNIIATLIIILSLVSLAGGLWTTIKISIIKLFSRKPELHWSALVWFLAAAVADVLITVTLVINLSKRKTGFAATNDAISKITRMTVQTCMLTAFFAVGDVIFFMTLPKTALNFIWDLALTKLYANCLLSSLNARAGIKESASHQSNQCHQISVTSGTSRLANPYMNDAVAHIHVESSLFEMDPRRDDRSFERSSRSHHDDVEFGIAMAKVVASAESPSGKGLTF